MLGLRLVKTQHFTTTPLCRNSLSNCMIAGGLNLTSPLKLMSYLSLIHRLCPSPQPQSQSQSVNTWPRRRRLACRSKPHGGSFNKSLMTPGCLQKSRLERRQFLSTVPNGRERETREREERVSEWAREGKHKRLLSVIRLPFNSPQGRHTPHFPSSQVQAALNSDPTALFSYIQHILLPKFHSVEGASAYSHIFTPSPGFKWRSASCRPPGKGAESKRRSCGILRPYTLRNHKSIGWTLKRCRGGRHLWVCWTRVATHSEACP